MPLESVTGTSLPGPLAGAIRKLLRLAELQDLYTKAVARHRFPGGLLDELGVTIEITAADFNKIPASGPTIAVSNHPFGILDGVALNDLLLRVRPDVRVLTSTMLSGFEAVGTHSIFIDPFERPENRSANGRALRQAISHVKSGGMLLIFPAGEVAHYDIRAGGIRDPRWNPTAARLIRMTGAKTVPLFVNGSNGKFFQALGMVHPMLRTAALPTEFLNKRGATVEVRVGGVIDAAQLKAQGDDNQVICYLRARTEILARRDLPSHQHIPSTEPVAAAILPAVLEREIQSLPATCRMETSRDLDVYIAEASQIPNVLREIGRLREITFRAAGEGTGDSLDLDRFDQQYLHLFLWNREKREVVGAYRLGDLPKLLRQAGRKGLYSNSLFRFERGYLESLGPALELGRSFVRPEYQKQFSPLLLLWKGVSAWVYRNPEYSTLIGPVSVSNQYSKASRELIAGFFDRERSRLWWQNSVQPRRPLRGISMNTLSPLLPDIDELSGSVSDLEADGKGIPILVKQYVKLGGRMLAFSVDPRFGDTLDGFVVVDLTRTQPETLGRYMGKERAAEFLALHRVRVRSPFSRRAA